MLFLLFSSSLSYSSIFLLVFFLLALLFLTIHPLSTTISTSLHVFIILTIINFNQYATQSSWIIFDMSTYFNIVLVS